jgi:hypothetical protein
MLISTTVFLLGLAKRGRCHTVQYTRVTQFCGSGSSQSGPLCSDPDPDPDPGLNKCPYLNFLVCVKAINTVLQEFLLVNFLAHEDTFYSKFSSKKNPEKS